VDEGCSGWRAQHKNSRHRIGARFAVAQRPRPESYDVIGVKRHPNPRSPGPRSRILQILCQESVGRGNVQAALNQPSLGRPFLVLLVDVHRMFSATLESVDGFPVPLRVRIGCL
jgi:hypothetical protein